MNLYTYVLNMCIGFQIIKSDPSPVRFYKKIITSYEFHGSDND